MLDNVKSLWQRFRRQAEPAPRYAAPEGRRLYAIGDVHGCRSELDRILSLIDDDLAGYEGGSELVFLGDYVDRGPESAGVIERLSQGDLPGDIHVFLSGNHEEAMLACLNGTGDVAEWLNYGGLQTLESYGLTRTELFRPDFDLKNWATRHFPRHHRVFLEGLRNSYRAGGYIFVHAGVRPGVSLREQSTTDFLWIRAGFIEDERDHGAMVVHGHTISKTVAERSNRIGIDTGCYLSGRLTAVVLEGDERRFLETR